jgi:hypothetical protein
MLKCSSSFMIRKHQCASVQEKSGVNVDSDGRLIPEIYAICCSRRRLISAGIVR